MPRDANRAPRSKSNHSWVIREKGRRGEVAAATRNTDPPPSPPPPSLIYTRGRRLYVPRSSLSDKLPFDWPTAIRYEQISYVNPIRPFPSPLLRRAFKMLTFSPLQKSLFLQRIDLETNLSSSHVLSFSLSLYIFIYIYISLPLQNSPE